MEAKCRGIRHRDCRDVAIGDRKKGSWEHEEREASRTMVPSPRFEKEDGRGWGWNCPPDANQTIGFPNSINARSYDWTRAEITIPACRRNRLNSVSLS